jgi:hypothetical protein
VARLAGGRSLPCWVTGDQLLFIIAERLIQVVTAMTQYRSRIATCQGHLRCGVCVKVLADARPISHVTPSTAHNRSRWAGSQALRSSVEGAHKNLTHTLRCARLRPRYLCEGRGTSQIMVRERTPPPDRAVRSPSVVVTGEPGARPPEARRTTGSSRSRDRGSREPCRAPHGGVLERDSGRR